MQSPSGTQREDGCCTPEPTGRGDILRGSLHARSFRLVPKAANAPQGRAAQLLCGAVAGPLFASAFSAIGAARCRVRLGTPAGELPGDRSSRMVTAHELRRRWRAVLLRWRRPAPLRQPTGRATRRPRPRGRRGRGPDRFRPVRHRPGGRIPARSPGGAGPDHARSGAAPTRAGRLHNLFAIPIFAGIPVAAMASAATAVRGRDSAGLATRPRQASPWSAVPLCSAAPLVTGLACPARVGSSSGYRSHAGAAGSPPFRYAPSPTLPTNQERPTSCPWAATARRPENPR